MDIFKKTPFGHNLFLKKWLIRIMGLITHSRYKGFNRLEIEGSEILRELPQQQVLFVSNHQTYFADVVAMFHVFNAALSGREDNIKNIRNMEIVFKDGVGFDSQKLFRSVDGKVGLN